MNASLTTAFTQIRANPSLLRRSLPPMVAKLQSQANSASQGTGNKVTDQEASFADVLESNGFLFQPKDAPFPTTAGIYYYYQANGSQQSIDFRVFETDGKTILRKVDLDLKHTSKDEFFLNDGWFHKDVVYIVTWTRRTSLPKQKPITSEAATYIALGQDIPTTEEHNEMKEMLTLKNQINTNHKKTGSLRIYARFANQYSCDRFTPEATEQCYATVSTYLHSSSVSDSSSVSTSA